VDFVFDDQYSPQCRNLGGRSSRTCVITGFHHMPGKDAPPKRG
jgi:hypothetical protein